MMECFPGIKTGQIHRATVKRDLGSPETTSVHVGTNSLRNIEKS